MGRASDRRERAEGGPGGRDCLRGFAPQQKAGPSSLCRGTGKEDAEGEHNSFFCLGTVGGRAGGRESNWGRGLPGKQWGFHHSAHNSVKFKWLPASVFVPPAAGGAGGEGAAGAKMRREPGYLVEKRIAKLTQM